MQFTILRETLLKPLQMVVGVVERRQAMPILGNVLIVIKDQWMSLTGTDTEIELVARIPLHSEAVSGQITVPAKKLVDICKALPEGAECHFALEADKLHLRAARSRFVLACLPASDYPNLDDVPYEIEFSLNQSQIKTLIETTGFAMAQQDVRYYLNGMYFEISPQKICVVATDGHRLATYQMPCHVAVQKSISIIVPRKAVLEILRIFAEGEEMGVLIGKNHLRIITSEYSFTTNLVEGSAPNYNQVIPRQKGHEVITNKALLRQALVRASVLLTEKQHGVSLLFNPGKLTLLGHNTEHEEVEDFLEIQYDGPPFDMGFNVHYLIEYLGTVRTQEVKITLFDPKSSILVEPFSKEKSEEASSMGEGAYVLMPMQI